MNRSELLKLWEVRFNDILKLESAAHREYKILLNEYSHILSGSRLRSILRRLMQDEKRHAKIAHQLVKLVRSKKIGSKV